LVIAEENKPYEALMGSADAPYINELADTYGLATAMDAGYPADCPSLPAYLILTSGDNQGICDDRDPKAHPIDGDNVFAQVAQAGLEWREYAESMPANCTPTNSADGLYLVRHAPPPYYVSERDRCSRWDVPMGSVSAGALHDDVAGGHLPAYSFLTPNACNDMHGGPSCGDEHIRSGDAWLASWIPTILDGPDFKDGKLVVIVTWDEGSKTDNHIPTLVIAPTAKHVRAATPMTHCSILRTTEEILRLPLLGCAARSASILPDFGL